MAQDREADDRRRYEEMHRRYDYGGREMRMGGAERSGDRPGDRIRGTTEGDFDSDFGTRGGGDGGRAERGDFARYGQEVGYLDRGWSGGSGDGSGGRRGMGAGYGSARGGGYADRRGGDFRGHQGGFDEPDAGRAYGRADDTPDWSAINRPGGQYAGMDESGPNREFHGEPNHRGRGPRNWTRPDDRILDDIHHRLTDDPRLDASDIEVAVEAGEVTLTGYVDSRQAKRRAEDCAESVSGVRHCQNNLRVREAGSGRSSEAGGNGGDGLLGGGLAS